MTEFLATCQLLALRDIAFTTDATFFAAHKDAVKAMFNHAKYRAMAKVLSPTLFVLGTSRKFSEFHQGIKLTSVKSSPKSMDAELTHPENFLPDIILECLGMSFRVALEMSGGKNVTIKKLRLDAERVLYESIWA